MISHSIGSLFINLDPFVCIVVPIYFYQYLFNFYNSMLISTNLTLLSPQQTFLILLLSWVFIILLFFSSSNLCCPSPSTSNYLVWQSIIEHIDDYHESSSYRMNWQSFPCHFRNLLTQYHESKFSLYEIDFRKESNMTFFNTSSNIIYCNCMCFFITINTKSSVMKGDLYFYLQYNTTYTMVDTRATSVILFETNNE